jgi:hypothetical protein
LRPEAQGSPALVEERDAVLLSTEPYRFTEAHADALERQPGKPVFLVDGRDDVVVRPPGSGRLALPAPGEGDGRVGGTSCRAPGSHW